jgi:hypothetical protein
MTLFSKLFHYVLMISSKYNIDESHSLKHSMDVLHFAHDIYSREVIKYPILKKQERMVYVAAVIHDMCDKKYMTEEQGIKNVQDYLEKDLKDNELSMIKEIISTMSYSTVKKNGFPYLGPYQHAYHIVREADLLAAYDFDRCMMYKMHLYGMSTDMDIRDVFDDAERLFETRVFKHNEDGLFYTEYAKEHHVSLHVNALHRMNAWRRLIANPRFL